MRPHRSYLTCHASPCTYGQRTFLHRTRQRPLRTMYRPTRLRHEAERHCNQISRTYSSSGREPYKAEAPIGVYTERKAHFELSFMQMGLGDSFRHLSRHINAYFKPKGSSGFVSALEGRLVGMNKQVRSELCGRTTLKNGEFREVQDSSISQSEQSQVSRAYPGQELFHPSSLVTRFGESYSYVAGHINYVFSKKIAGEQIMEVTASEDGLGRSSTISRVTPKKSTLSRGNSAVHINSTDDCSSWEEGYLHFARHINRYFGAKVADTVKESIQSYSTGSGTSNSVGRQQSSPASHHRAGPGSRTQDSQDLHRPKSLFHMSDLSTRFGESHAYISTHINHYFKGPGAADEEMERDPYREQPESKITQERPMSYIQHILNTSAIPRIVGTYFGITSNSSATTDTKDALDRLTVRRQLADEKTRVLLHRLEEARARSSVNSCIEELNAHLILHPACKTVVWQEKAAKQILKHRRLFATDEKLQAAIRETLALTGYVDPLKGRGIRVLSIDGGGTRGVVPLHVLKQLEVRTGRRVYQLFDYVCGVSTGAVLAFMLALAQFSIEECEEMYRRFGTDVFRQNPFLGTVKMGWSHSYYNTETWELILKEKIGDQLLIKTARDNLCPKVSAVSAVVNWGTSPKPFIFRNYNHSPMHLSRYAGGSGYQLWQAVRASSAAPGYFQEFPLYNDIHQDGGIILNNPSALAVHESRLLWPNQPFQCVLSLGTGRYDNARRGPATSTSLRAKISNLISSATDTEGVHILLADLLEPNVYFRFNPMLSAEVSLDESRPGALQQLQRDTMHYLERNEPKLELLCSVLGEERTTLWKTRDWISEKAWELRQHWI